MLSNRSRTMTTKQNPTRSQTKPDSSFFGSPRFFEGAVMSPTSILDTKLFSNFVNPFGSDKPHPENKQLIGLALVDSLIHDETNEECFNPVLFGSKLKVQIPDSEISLLNSPKSPGDFGIKTRNCCVQTSNSPRVSTGGLNLREIEMSEDYTCVISHGPIPKTTHIYDNCIVESSYGVTEFPMLKRKKSLKSPSLSFLSYCHSCKKNIGEDEDIFMYGGDKAFCSYECRYEKMLYDEINE